MTSRGNHGKNKKKSKKHFHHPKENSDTAKNNKIKDISEDGMDEISKQFSDGKTFLVRTSKVMGRYMVAAKDLSPGDVILSEKPLVVGPCTDCRVQCIACYHPIAEHEPYVRCKSCQWPLCSDQCKSLWTHYGHTKRECKLLQECKSGDFLDYTDFDKLRVNFYCIVPLRCFLLQETDPLGYKKLMAMENHDNIRRNIPEVWNLNQTIVDRVVKDWKLEYTEEQVHSMCGVLEVNAFEIGQQGINIRGLYPSAFLMSHNCVPNTSHCDEEQDYKLSVRASTTIRTNQAITLSYAYTLQSTLKRREHLLENKFFACTCQRCADKTELGTYVGALRCPKCKDGLVLSEDPLNPEAVWSCSNKAAKNKAACPGYTLAAKAMELLTNRISSELDEIDSNNISAMESLLEKYRNVLHPNHYLNLEVKLNLSQLYGKINGYLIHEMSDEELRRKMEICKEILKIFDVIEPGYTRIRGVTLYELHAPVLILTTRQFERHLLSRHQLRARIREVVRCLEEACIILANEPPHSSEGMMSTAADDALIRMREWLTKI